MSAKVSVIVPCRNEISNLPRTLAMLERQTLQPNEVVFSDGMSTDGSREWLEEAAESRPWMVVVDNHEKRVPAALNVALSAATGEYIARMDTHAEYHDDYLEVIIRFLEDHPAAGGAAGAMETRGVTPWGRAIAATLKRRFGLGGASHRVGAPMQIVPHAFSPSYRRAALLDAGGWDERLSANEDFEADVRLRAAGWQLWLLPDTGSTWYVRETPAALIKQMWRYGYFKALTLRLHPASLQFRQLAPPALVATLALYFITRSRVLGRLIAAYAVAASVLGARAARDDGADPLRGAVAPPLIHLPWGAGLLAGLVRFAGVASTPLPPGHQSLDSATVHQTPGATGGNAEAFAWHTGAEADERNGGASG